MVRADDDRRPGIGRLDEVAENLVRVPVVFVDGSPESLGGIPIHPLQERRRVRHEEVRDGVGPLQIDGAEVRMVALGQGQRDARIRVACGQQGLEVLDQLVLIVGQGGRVGPDPDVA